MKFLMKNLTLPIPMALALLTNVCYADNSLSRENIKGHYALKSANGSIDAELQLNNRAMLAYFEKGKSVRCKGDYNLDEKMQILKVKLSSCGREKSSVAYTLYLSGQSPQSLREKTYALVSSNMHESYSRVMPFSIERINN